MFEKIDVNGDAAHPLYRWLKELRSTYRELHPDDELAMEALMLTRSRISSDVNNAYVTAHAAATQTPARMREETDGPRLRKGVMYSLGSGSPSLSERKRGTKGSPSMSRWSDRRDS